MITYQLDDTNRNKILNYKETVNSICFDEDVSSSLDIHSFQCKYSEFCDPHHKHRINRDFMYN